jgi:Arc/MetJ-type ribon-helix-helix transcriptional regulator
MPPREHMNFRLGAKAVEWIDTLAIAESVEASKRITRSDVIRASLAVARKYEPEVKKLLRDQL